MSPHSHPNWTLRHYKKEPFPHNLGQSHWANQGSSISALFNFDNFYSGDCPKPWRLFGSTPSLYPLDASSILCPRWQPKIIPDSTERWRATGLDTPASYPRLRLREASHPPATPIHLCSRLFIKGLAQRQVSICLVAFRVAWSFWAFQRGEQTIMSYPRRLQPLWPAAWDLVLAPGRDWMYSWKKKDTYFSFSNTPTLHWCFPIGEHSSYPSLHRDDIKAGLTVIGLIFRSVS